VDEPMLYADLTFIINFIMDSIILWATSRLAGTPIILPRLFAGALIGALYSVIYLYSPDAVWYSLPAKICFSFIVVAIGLYPQNWQQFKKVLIYFYAISFAAAGASIAVSYLVLIPGQEFRFSYLWLLAGAVFVLLAGIFGEKYLIAKIVPSLLKFNVQIRIGSESCNGQGFLDTGNGLKDPLTDRPVVVAEYNLLRKCMPKDFQDIFDLVWNENDMLENLSRSSWANRLRIIPFSSIGKKNGILVGIRSDSIVVNTGRKDVIHNNVVVGIYKERLSHDGSYQLLIPSEIMNN
jgi:stage II sporulation protein GA (sporulation sigma-E factor processing peptidase)